MLPTLKLGSHFIAQKWGFGNYRSFGLTVFRTSITAEVRRGDIVVFDFPRDPSVQYAKRVIGVPGDVVEFKNRQLTINGSKVETVKAGTMEEVFTDKGAKYETFNETLSAHTYAVAYAMTREQRDFQFDVPSGHYFVLGDNRDHSNDSRYWGFVPEKNLVGKLVYVFE